MNRRDALRALAATAGVAVGFPTIAQNENIIRLTVPYAPGGQTDIIARALAASMQKTLSRNVIVENRPGAAGLIATRYVQASPPDGSNLLFHNSGMVLVPMLQRSANYDTEKDFAAVAMTGIGPNFLMVTDSVPAKTVPEFIAWAKTQTNGIECANSGINSGGHIAALMLEKLANIKLIHIPFKGSAEVATAMISGQVKMQVSVITDAMSQYVKAGKIRLLAVNTKDRSALAPELPTLKEFIPGCAIDGWYGVLTSAGTPMARREQLAAAIKTALDDKTVRDRFLALYMEPTFRGPADFSKSIANSTIAFRDIVQKLELVQQ